MRGVPIDFDATHTTPKTHNIISPVNKVMMKTPFSNVLTNGRFQFGVNNALSGNVPGVGLARGTTGPGNLFQMWAIKAVLDNGARERQHEKKLQETQAPTYIPTHMNNVWHADMKDDSKELGRQVEDQLSFSGTGQGSGQQSSSWYQPDFFWGWGRNKVQPTEQGNTQMENAKKEVFDALDVHKTGKLKLEDAKELGLSTAAFSALDRNSDGIVDLKEIVHVNSRALGALFGQHLVQKSANKNGA